jgi:hypothetical protein
MDVNEIEALVSKILRKRGVAGVYIAKIKGQKRHVTWKAHASTYILKEDTFIAFGSTPQEALTGLIQRIDRFKKS